MASVAVDVLCECFALLRFSDRVTATHVCRHWRQASLSRPGSLWSHIVSNGTRAGVVRQLFERSQNAPVQVQVLLTDETFEDAMDAVSQNLFHIHQLHLFSLDRVEDGLAIANIHPVYRALAQPAPMLEEIEIALHLDNRTVDEFDAEDDDELALMALVLNFDYRIPTDLFAGDAPCLRKAAFFTMQLHPDGVPALAGLTQLKYDNRVIPASQIAAIVTTLPNLRALCINSEHGYELPDTPPPPSFRLDELDLDMLQMSDNESLGPLLDYLGYQHIREVTVYRLDGLEWLQAFVAPPRTLPHTLHLYSARRGLSNWHMVDSEGYGSRGFALNTAELLNAPLARDIFARVRTLVLSAPLLSQDIPPLYQLTHLSLCFSRREEMPLHAAAPRATRILCPTLRLLEICGAGLIAGLAPTEKLALSVGDLERFLENVFSFSRHQLPHIVLRHASLDISELLQDQSVLGALSFAEEPLAVPEALDAYLRHRKWHVCIDE